MQDGILVVDKPAGMTSHDVVQKLRRAYQIKRVGHTGTLDPIVTGVMVVCFGKATKLSQFLIDEDKCYRVTMKLGESTDTEDITGKILEQKQITQAESLTIQKQLPEVLETFKGSYWQTPPMYSAIKIGGKKLYEYARDNIEIKRSAREIIVSDIKYDEASYCYEPTSKAATCNFDVFASKGLYARTICVDIGKKLGVPATMAKLTRLQSGSYQLGQAKPLAEILEQKPEFISIDEIILPMEEVYVGQEIADKLRVGYKLPHYFLTEKMQGQFAVYEQDTKKLIGIYSQSEKYPDKYQSVRVM